MINNKSSRLPNLILMKRNGIKSQNLATFSYNLPLAFLLLLLLFPTQNAASGGFRLCGLKLTMTLNAICKNQLCGGYIMGMAKRKSPDLASITADLSSNENNNVDDGNDMSNLDEIMQQIYGGDDNVNAKQRRQRGKDGTGGRHKRAYYPYGAFGLVKKSGIATQCCEKRCTLAYLKTYCCAAPAPFQEEEEAKEAVEEQQEERRR